MSKHSIVSACALVVCCYALARPAVAEFTGNTGPTVRSADVATRGLDAGSSERLLSGDADAVANLQRNSNQARSAWRVRSQSKSPSIAKYRPIHTPTGRLEANNH